ncbi:MAG: hypothetical protein IIA62_03070 [Nitrospinae bacterium]|nr:hypothetical protein [Nitrospinota bacterium]
MPDQGYSAYQQGGGALSHDDWIVAGRPLEDRDSILNEFLDSDTDLYNAYKAAGGELNFVTWLKTGKPTAESEEETRGNTERGDLIEESFVYQNEDGLWVDPLP